VKSIFLVATIFAFVAIGRGQSPETFHGRLGNPEKIELKEGKVITETYRYDSKFRITIAYSKSQIAESLQIAPEASELRDVQTDPVVKQDELQSALDRIVSPEEKGKYICGTFLNVICLPTNDCAGVRWDYEKVSIYYNSGNGGTRYALLAWRAKPVAGNCSTMSKGEPYTFNKNW